MKSPTIYRRNLRREKNDRLVSVHTSIDCERFSEKISAEACSGKEIAGLLKKMMMNREIAKLHMSGFSRGKPEAGRNELGLCTARYESKSCC